MSNFTANHSVFNNVAGDQYNIVYITNIQVVQPLPAPPQRRSLRNRFTGAARRLLQRFRRWVFLVFFILLFSVSFSLSSEAHRAPKGALQARPQIGGDDGLIA
jgi:hypothetical protein